jgi:hypothetical protein
MHEQTEMLGRAETAGSDGDDLNAPIEWAGLPAFHAVTRDTRLVLSFDTPEQRDELIAKLELVIAKKTGPTWSAWWPPRDREDLTALRFDFDADEQGEDELEPPASPEAPDTAAVDPGVRAAGEGYGRDLEEDGWP